MFSVDKPIQWSALPGILVVVALLLTLIACGGGSPMSSAGGTGNSGGSSSNSGGSSSNSGGSSSNSGGSSLSAIPPVQHVVIVVLENLDYGDIVASADAPYINSLIAQGSLAANYYANVHPSIGNYFIMTTGIAYSTDDTFSGVVPIDNVVRELTAAAKTWKVYAQSLPSQGYLGGDVYPYLRRHNPISYFSDVQPPSQASMNIVDFSQLSTDLGNGQLPEYSFIVPDAEHDAHDCPDGSSDCDVTVRVAAADAWLSNNISPLFANPQFQESGVLVLTTDESRTDNTNGGGRIATVIVGSRVKAAYVGTGLYDHRSLLGLSMTALSANIPNGAGDANQMTEFFQ